MCNKINGKQSISLFSDSLLSFKAKTGIVEKGEQYGPEGRLTLIDSGFYNSTSLETSFGKKRTEII